VVGDIKRKAARFNGLGEHSIEVIFMLLTSTNIILLFQDGNPAPVIICCGIPIVLIIVFIVVGVQGAKAQEALRLKRQQELQNAKENYYQSLKILKSNPTNADLKQKTLMLGRRYSELTRQAQSGNKSITIYDEMALMNDINAACAAAMNFSIHQNTRTESVEERLAKLNSLKEKGLIDEQEFQTQRQNILKEI
jgi:hypothetical protein